MTDKAYDVLMLNADAVRRGVLPMWTIYDRPKDHPDGFIARRFESIMPTGDTLTGELEELRAIFINAGLFKLPRSDGDEPQIVETWL
jgi:hypothetical protein